MSYHTPLDQPIIYQICVKGHLGDEWEGYFDALKIERSRLVDGTAVTTLTGPFVDQAALQGTLQSLYGLGLGLISLQPMVSEAEKRA